jgi:hypothetical protein
MKLVVDDGGRAFAGYLGSAGDCVTRSIAIATESEYEIVYAALFEGNRKLKLLRERGKSPRDGVSRKVYDKYLKSMGWNFHPTMTIGSGCKVHLKSDELPSGRLIVRLSRHLAAVVDGVLHDTYDCSRDGTRCVYGYYSRE